TKISILLLYLRLLVPQGTKWTPIWWSIWLCFWYNILYAIALVLAEATECAGRQQPKNRTVPNNGSEQCINEYALLICASAVNVSSDIMILIIPTAAIWGLHMPTHKKWKLSAIFLIGGFAVVSSVVRLGYEIAASRRPNQSIAISTIAVLKLGEQFIGVVVSCLPILPAFYRHVRSSNNTNREGGGLEESILGYQRGKRSTANKDPFPVSAANGGELTTRGYEELDELEAQPKVHVTKSEWETQQPRTAKVPPFVQPFDPARDIARDTEVELSSESR
ncbi:MAG: hypothetical protein Q9195_009640, partial [Heterodermia aff. obscurata]